MFSGVGSNLKRGGDLLGGTGFHVAEDESGALGGGEFLHGAGLECFNLLAVEEPLRVGGAVRDLDLMLSGVGVLGDLVGGIGFAFVLQIEGTIDSNTVDPG